MKQEQMQKSQPQALKITLDGVTGLERGRLWARVSFCFVKQLTEE